jgi:hypothetical protein
MSKGFVLFGLQKRRAGKGVEKGDVEEIAFFACPSTVPWTSSIFVRLFLSYSEPQVVGTVCKDGSTQHAQKDQGNN